MPNEFLGRFYYPELECAVLISATTWLRGGFDCARGYLGLDRAAEPAADEEREPCRVRTFRAPDPFDYRRVLVCVPSDAPAYRDKRAFDDYVRAFVAYLGERTRGRLLVLFTNADDARRAGQELAGFFRARRIPFWFQNMAGHGKEELGLLFRERVDSILLGVDTFWYGADFPGETLEYLVIVKLPYGVPDALPPGPVRRAGRGRAAPAHLHAARAGQVPPGLRPPDAPRERPRRASSCSTAARSSRATRPSCASCRSRAARRHPRTRNGPRAARACSLSEPSRASTPRWRT